jgi:hypothetical protein
MKRTILISLGLILTSLVAKEVSAQSTPKTNEIVVRVTTYNGESLPTIVTPEVKVISTRYFKNPEDNKKFRAFKYNASVVRPYAIEAISLYREITKDFGDMKKKDKKKYTRKLQKEYTSKYKDKLVDLSKEQGFVLIKMIERELDTPFNDVITEIRGGWEAAKWSVTGAFFGYNLKKGYNPKDDKLLEIVLKSFDITYTKNTINL